MPPRSQPSRIYAPIIERIFHLHFELEIADGRLAIVAERHYRLVDPDEIAPADLDEYRSRPPE